MGQGLRTPARPAGPSVTVMSSSTRKRHRVVIAGGGVAGLEAMLSLAWSARDRVDVTVVSPSPEFRLRALSVNEPFARSKARSWPVEQMCSEHGARFVRDAVASVDTGRRSVTLTGGDVLEYDALLVAVGARAERALDGRISVFRGPQDVELVHGLVQDVEGGYTSKVAFVVPDGTTWPLPLYELALMLADRAHDMNMDDVRVSVLTAEGEPLDVFGAEASAAVRRRLHDAGIDLRTSVHVAAFAAGRVVDDAGQPLVEAQRVVALPRLHGQALEGLPHDADGFVPVDPHGRVRGLDAVWAAGDGTVNPIKQGGVAAEQAIAAAADIARTAGAEVPQRPFVPVLRAELTTGRHPLFLRHAVGEGRSAAVSERPLWWPHAKVAAPHLAAWLAGAEHTFDPRTDTPTPRRLHAEGDPSGGIELLR